MSELKEIAKLYVITDTEVSYDNIGDIDISLFDDTWLKNHIKNYGTEDLLENLGILNRQILNTKYELNAEQSNINNTNSIK